MFLWISHKMWLYKDFVYILICVKEDTYKENKNYIFLEHVFVYFVFFIIKHFFIINVVDVMHKLNNFDN